MVATLSPSDTWTIGEPINPMNTYLPSAFPSLYVKGLSVPFDQQAPFMIGCELYNIVRSEDPLANVFNVLQ